MAEESCQGVIVLEPVDLLSKSRSESSIERKDRLSNPPNVITSWKWTSGDPVSYGPPLPGPSGDLTVTGGWPSASREGVHPTQIRGNEFA